ncbi:hypothetical protein BpHYR1_012057 [Brachionus plicatilis]|uniref:Uncharacterized protein n=1 Tax=Brachionus plicatilis TaxID=10195 RepID=A0A3M7SVT8_BRAPC|nr:hypothetical protein BpHYR1_012057 [Brachionus plicatilis]
MSEKIANFIRIKNNLSQAKDQERIIIKAQNFVLVAVLCTIALSLGPCQNLSTHHLLIVCRNKFNLTRHI